MEIIRVTVGMVETNCYIAFNRELKQAVVVDPGDSAEKIADECERLGAEVKAILLTHGHFDHIMAVEELREKWKVSVYASEREAEILANDEYNLTSQFMRIPLGLKADVLLKDKETLELIGYTFQMLETPGHTFGSCCYYVESEKALFSGDTLFDGSYGRVDFPTSSSQDMLHSVAEVLLSLPDDVKVYPGHMGYTTIGDERKHNPLAPFRGRGL